MRLNTCYERFGLRTDLDNAIAAYQEAIESVDPCSPLRPALLMNQANALCTRYEKRGLLDDVDEAIEKAEEALAAGHESTAILQNDLSTMYLSRYEREGDINDLGEVISLSREALSKSKDDPSLTTRLIILATAYQHGNSASHD